MIIMEALLVLVCFAILPMGDTSSTPESQLLRHLLKDYIKLPPFNYKDPINVTFGIELIQLLKVDDRAQVITTKVWVRQSWKNPYLAWDPAQWSGISRILVDPKEIWTPDIVLYDSTDAKRVSHESQIVLYPNGYNSWYSPAVFQSTCKIDIEFFPFDRQHCSMKFGSYHFDSTLQYMKHDNKDIIQNANYVPSTEWEVESVERRENLVKYKCCPHPYSDIAFVLHMKRKSSFYVFNLIAPCIVLAFTILFSFFLPPVSGERIGLTITILLAMAVLMQVLSTTMPGIASVYS